jgi:hypothetical protein
MLNQSAHLLSKNDLLGDMFPNLPLLSVQIGVQI